MALWENVIITSKGENLLAKLVSGHSLSLVRAVAGAEYVDPDGLISQTEVPDVRQELSFGTISYPNVGSCTVPVKLTNEGVSDTYMAFQIGIMAFDPDEGEILFLVCQATNRKGTEVPAGKAIPGFSAEWNFTVRYGQADGVTVVVDPSNTVSVAEVQAMIEEHDKSETPHADVLATKEEVSGVADAVQTTREEIQTMREEIGQQIADITPESLGLGNVDNTPDSQKNVSFASEASVARKVEHELIVRLKGGDIEGTDKWTYDGSTSKSINVTAAKLGALSTAGGAMEGDLTTHGIILTEGIDYGTELPEPGTKGRLFFKVVS